MSELNKHIVRLRQLLQLDTRIGYLGDGTGEVHDRRYPGRYYVRFTQAGGGYTAPISIPANPNANLPTDDEFPVDIGYDASGQMIILRANVPGMTESGYNALQLNPLDRQASQFVNQDQIVPFYATRHPDPTKLLTAIVYPGLFTNAAGSLISFVGAEIDLSSFVPASPNHCYVVVLRKDDATLEAFASTPINVADPLTVETDIQECLNAASTYSEKIWAWELRHDDTELTVDKSRMIDLRSFMADLAIAVILAPTTDARNVIQPTADTVVGLAIKQFSATHSDNLMEWQDSTGTVMSRINNEGAYNNVIVSGTKSLLSLSGTTSASTGASLSPAVNNNNVNVRGISFNPTITGSGTGPAGAGYVVTIAPTGNIAVAYAAISRFIAGTSSSNIGLAIGALFRVDTSAGYSGTITTASQFYADVPIYSGTVPTNVIGLTVANQGNAGTTTSVGVRILSQSGSSSANIALETNTGLVIFNEGGDANSDFRVEGDTDINLLFTDASADRVGMGTAAPSTKLHTLLTDAGTNAIVNVLTVGHDSSGTPATSYGTGIIIEGKSSTTASQSMGRLTYEWATATHASRKARAKWTVFDTAEREGIRIEASGTAPMIGFYGHASAAQSPAYTVSNVTTDRTYDANSTTVDELADVVGTLIADLQATGLMG